MTYPLIRATLLAACGFAIDTPLYGEAPPAAPHQSSEVVGMSNRPLADPPEYCPLCPSDVMN